MKLNKNKKYALSLAGGGFKGSYQAGALQALHDEGYKFSAVVGTSVGALNGVMVAQNDFKNLKAMWASPETKEVFKVENTDAEKDIKINLNERNIFELGKRIFDIAHSKGIDTEPLVKMIQEYSDEEGLRKNDAKFGLVAINLTDKKVEEIMLDEMPKGYLADYLLATAYLPVFKKVKLHGKYYLDGGYANNLPTNMLVERGYKDIIEIKLSEKEKSKKYNANIKSLAPSEDLGQSIIYSEDKLAYNYKLGYHEGLRLARNAHGYKYILEGDKTESFFVNKFLELNPNVVFEYNINMDKYESIEKAILSDLVFQIAKNLDIKKSFSYEKLYVTLLECTAEKLGIERFQVYTLKEFEKLIVEEYKKSSIKDINMELAITLIG